MVLPGRTCGAIGLLSRAPSCLLTINRLFIEHCQDAFPGTHTRKHRTTVYRGTASVISSVTSAEGRHHIYLTSPQTVIRARGICFPRVHHEAAVRWYETHCLPVCRQVLSQKSKGINKLAMCVTSPLEWLSGGRSTAKRG